MSKNALFLLKNCKNRPAPWTPPPSPLASGCLRILQSLILNGFKRP